MAMPGRFNEKTGFNNYTFGFNGKENDKETGYQDYGFRLYDRKIARFITPDPLIVNEQKYPELSSYQFASNRPIDGVDIDGLEYGSGTFVNGALYNGSTLILPTTDKQAQAQVSYGKAQTKGTITGSAAMASGVAATAAASASLLGYIGIKTLDNAINAGVQYGITGNIDVIPLVLNYIPIPGTKKLNEAKDITWKLLKPVAIGEGLKSVADAGIDYNLLQDNNNSQGLKSVVLPQKNLNKPFKDASIDLVSDAISKSLNLFVSKTTVTETESKASEYMLSIPTTGGSNAIKSDQKED
jgi:RHS repeat-associated protein